MEGLLGNRLFEGIVLLVLTALVTGLAVPRVKAAMDMRHFREQRAHEADLARQAARIKDQSDLLASFIDLIWRLHFAMIRISYDRAVNRSRPLPKALWTEYETRAWETFQNLRRLISGSIHLVSPGQFERLMAFYEQMLREEAELSFKVRQKNGRPEWPSYHSHLMTGVSAELDRRIAELATDLDLTPLQTPHRRH